MPQSRSVPLPVQPSRCFVGSSLRMCLLVLVDKELSLAVTGRLAPPGAGRKPTPIGSLVPSVAMPLQRGVEAVDQGVSGEGLGQEADRSRFQGSYASAVDGESRDENEGHAVSLGKQVSLQLKTAHRRHLNVGYHARGVIQVRRPQEFLGRRERMNDVSKRPHEIAGRGANRAVVVDD